MFFSTLTYNSLEMATNHLEKGSCIYDNGEPIVKMEISQG